MRGKGLATVKKADGDLHMFLLGCCGRIEGRTGRESFPYQTNVGGPSSATQIFFANKIHIQVSHSQEFDGLIPAGNFLDPKKFHGANLTNNLMDSI
jgi:hypothetical protein